VFCSSNFAFFNEQKYELGTKKYEMRKKAIEAQENSFKNFKIIQKKKQDLVRKIKLHIINGELEEAKLMLKEATLTKDFTKTIQFRYLAMVHFIEGNYKKVLRVLNEQEMKNYTPKAKTCILKTISLIILNQNEMVKDEWKRCRETVISKSGNSLDWLQTVVNLKTTKRVSYIDEIFKDVSVDNLFDDKLRLYLKLALYLNKQDKVIPRFKYFGFDQIKDERTRELIGLNHFRNHELTKAYEFLEDLETVNAEIFKGNLYLHKGNLDLAFAQYKLALKKKKNSQNALERIVPLSWKLKQWDQGYLYSQSLSHTRAEIIEDLSLKAVFLTMSERTDEAEKYLEKITSLTHSASPLEVSQIYAVNALNQKKYYIAEKYAGKGCAAKDAMNCWFSMQLSTWEDFGKMLKRDEPIHDNKVDLAEMLSSEQINEPYQDNKYIEQARIEELDNNLIELLPKK
jgi:tetratricopeptide (TPR) repeat protein